MSTDGRLGKIIITGEHGDITIWREADQQATVAWEVWGAQGYDPGGHVHQVFGSTRTQATLALLGALERARLAAPEVTASVPLAFRPLPDFVGPEVTAGYECIPQADGSAAGPLGVREPASPYERGSRLRSDLPQAFWYCLRSGQRIQAIKELRDATGMSLRSAKDVVDLMSETARLSGPEPFTAADQVAGTVIRVNGVVGAGQDASAGYVFEKMGPDEWSTTGEMLDWLDSAVQAAARNAGYELLYVPKAVA